MAIIFYHSAGTIYGVHHTHPDDLTFVTQQITLPEGIQWIEVPGLPHEITWPKPTSMSKGTEHTSRIVIRNGKPELDVDPTKESLFMNGVHETQRQWRNWLDWLRQDPTSWPPASPPGIDF